MVSTPETLEERFIRVREVQKRTLIVRADDFRADNHGVYSHAGDMGLIAWSMAKRSLNELLPLVDEVRALAGAPGAGKTTWIDEHGIEGVLYLDSMLSRRKTRRDVCAMAAAAHRPIDCVFIDTPFEVCIARNRERSPDRRVPESYIMRAHRRLTVCPPADDEGWRGVTHIEYLLTGASLDVDGMLDNDGRDL
jgi:hypothetical protein